MTPYQLPGHSLRRTVSLRGQERTLEIPTASDVLRAKAEASRLEADNGQQVLIRNACLLARALTDGRSPLFSDGAQVMDTLTPREIENLSEEFRGLLEEAPPSPAAPAGRAEEYKKSLKEDPEGRLRWKVLRAFHALPTEERVRKMTPEDYLYCGLNLILDQEEASEGLCPMCRETQRDRCPCCGAVMTAQQGAENPNFDRGRFEALSREVAK